MAAAAMLAVASGQPPKAAAETRPAYGGVVIGSLLGEPTAVDPLRAQSHADVTLVSLLYDTLYRYDQDGQLVPHLAAVAPAASQDGREVRIPLRAEVRFHDGSPVTARDVARSLRALAQDKTQVALAPLRQVRPSGVDVVLSLSRPWPELAASLASPATAISKPHGPQRDALPVGSGPFRLGSPGAGGSPLRLLAFEDHFSGRPYPDELILHWSVDAQAEARRYELGDSHWSLRGDVAFSGHVPKYETRAIEGEASLLVYVGFGRRGRYGRVTGNGDFRRALSLAISRDGFRHIGSGERVVPTVYAAAPDLGEIAAAPQQTRADPRGATAAMERAAATVSEVRHLRRRAGAALLEVLVDETRPDDRDVAKKIVAALFRLDIAARVAIVPARLFAERVGQGLADLYIGHLAAPSRVPAVVTAAAFAAGGDAWASRHYRREPLSQELARAQFTARLPIVPLFHRSVRVHYRNDLRGVGFDWLNRILLADVYLFARPQPHGSVWHGPARPMVPPLAPR